MKNRLWVSGLLGCFGVGVVIAIVILSVRHYDDNNDSPQSSSLESATATATGSTNDSALGVPQELLSVPVPVSVTSMTKTRLIHYGWDNPRIWSLAKVLPLLKTSIFDGISVSASQYNEIFRATAYPNTIINDDKDYLDQLDNVNLLQNSYLQVHSRTDDVFDWNNENHWTNTLSNMRLLVQLAKYGQFRGIVFDMEPYGKSPWDYSTQSAASNLSFAQMSTLVRKRGRSMMDMMQMEFPGIEIWCLYGLSALDDDYSPDLGNLQAALAEAGYGLWASFFNGWIDNMDTASTTIVEGNEPSYYFTRTAQFAEQKRHVRNDLAAFLSGDDAQSKYKASVKMGHAVYVDGVMNMHQSPRFIGYYFHTNWNRTRLLRSNTLNALQSSESLVWVYSEINKWWSAPSRRDIDTAIRRACSDYTAGKSPPKPWWGLRNAETGLKNARSIGGTFSSADGSMAYQPSHWGTTLNNNACATWGDKGQYSCTYPNGSTVTITPTVDDDHTVIPKSQTFPSLAADNWSVDWIVQ
jgi:hypothetical protein